MKRPLLHFEIPISCLLWVGLIAGAIVTGLVVFTIMKVVGF